VSTSLLVLWDIDHTLIQTGGVGTEVFRTAYKDATGTDLVNPPDPTGKLEPALFEAACDANGVRVSAELFATFAEAQVKAYLDRADDMRSRGRVLPGVPAVLRHLSTRSGVIQTVLSGNTLAAGRAKLEIFSLSDYVDFACAVGGADAPTRPELVRVAWNRTLSASGHHFSSVNTVVIGDTPADVDTAKRNDCRIVAVATGRTTADALREAGAEIVLPDLSDLRVALQAIVNPNRLA
jgi:phosphoglycolate phosphatase-like HAD superfamily hydrolase